MQELTADQFSLVYNAFSFTLAAMTATTLFLWISRSQVSSAYKTAITISGLVTGIAAYHYYRIFESWNAAYTVKSGIVTVTGVGFVDAYRYVDWLLTVPLLLIELVLVMRLSKEETVSRGMKLGLAAMLMIILGYPGEIAGNNATRALWGTLSAIPFTYIMWSLFAGLSKAIESQPENVRNLVKQARLLTFASWGFYPIVYMIPYTSLSGATTSVAVQLGYTLADIIAKAGVGILIYNIAIRKSATEADGVSTPYAA